jgi:hypothetical protein
VIGLFIFVAVAAVGFIFWVTKAERYRPEPSNVARLLPTPETYIDPETGRRQRVWIDPATGERAYADDLPRGPVLPPPPATNVIDAPPGAGPGPAGPA